MKLYFIDWATAVVGEADRELTCVTLTYHVAQSTKSPGRLHDTIPQCNVVYYAHRWQRHRGYQPFTCQTLHLSWLIQRGGRWWWEKDWAQFLAVQRPGQRPQGPKDRHRDQDRRPPCSQRYRRSRILRRRSTAGMDSKHQFVKTSFPCFILKNELGVFPESLGSSTTRLVVGHSRTLKAPKNAFLEMLHRRISISYNLQNIR